MLAHVGVPVTFTARDHPRMGQCHSLSTFHMELRVRRKHNLGYGGIRPHRV